VYTMLHPQRHLLPNTEGSNVMTSNGADVRRVLCSIMGRGGGQAPDGARTAVVIQKTSATPRRYPRQAGIPKKTPL